jgi:hypothetical protein
MSKKSTKWTSMALLILHHALLTPFSADTQSPLYPCVFSRARNSSAPQKRKKTYFALQTCTTKNDTILGTKRAKLVGMVGFSTLLKSEEANAKGGIQDTTGPTVLDSETMF